VIFLTLVRIIKRITVERLIINQMENKKTKMITIAFVGLTILTTGCGITLTRNYYYGNPDQQEKTSTHKGSKNNIPVDILTNRRNEFN
jgi:hypothetical protein